MNKAQRDILEGRLTGLRLKLTGQWITTITWTLLGILTLVYIVGILFLLFAARGGWKIHQLTKEITDIRFELAGED